MLQALQSRTSTFIASKEWSEIPFSIYQPSPMQCLITETAALPTLLRQTDQLLMSASETNHVRELCNAYLEILSRLESWEASFRDTTSPQFWTCSTNPSSRAPAPLDLCLWFPNITMANVYTHLWSFRIICVSEVSQLVSLFPSVGWCDSRMSTFIPDNCWEFLRSLSLQICSSMEYLMQDDLRLFGPMSSMLPLRTAYKVLIGDKNGQNQHIAYIKKLVEWLVGKRIRSAPYMVYT
jgi:hypothetical protein